MPVEALGMPFELPAVFVRFIGACEVLGALGLILPGVLRIRTHLTPLAALVLTTIMVGAAMFTPPDQIQFGRCARRCRFACGMCGVRPLARSSVTNLVTAARSRAR